MSRYVLDIETDGFYDDVTKIWCAVAKNIKDGTYIYLTNPDDTDFVHLFRDTDLLIMHNGIDFDVPVIKKILGVDYKGKVFDTYTASCLLNPDRVKGHSLKAWGERFNFPKGDHSDWTKYSTDMMVYCKRDVDVCERIYNELEPIISN